MVEEGVYRGAYPSLINLRFLSRLGLKSMVSLLPEPPAPHLLRWCEENGVRNHAERVAAPREGTGEQEVTLTHERVADLLQLLVLPERQPVYVHCLDGVVITGTLMMCLRKLQRWSMPPLIAEYARFARDGLEVPGPPPPHFLAFVHAFKPELEFARQNERLLPERLPFWLEAALSAPAPAGAAGSGRPQASAEGSLMLSSASALPHEDGSLSRDRGGAEGRARRPHGGGDAFAALDTSGTLEAKGEQRLAGGVNRFKPELDALALEGLTMGQRTQRRAAPSALGHQEREADANWKEP